MRGFFLSIAIHAAGVLGLVVLPSFSASELPPTTQRPEPPIWLPPVVRVQTVAPPRLLPRRPAGGGGTTLPTRKEPHSAPPAAISEDPLRPEDIELPGGKGAGEGPPDSSQLPGFAAPPSVAALPEPPRLVRAHVEVRPPRRLAGANPVYPPLAIATGTRGTVILECTIGSDGHVRDVRVVKGHPLFDRAAVDAVLSWSYAPTLLRGVPVAVLMTVTVEFKLNR